MNGPATDHFFRSGEWNRSPLFFVPTATTTLPFLIADAMSTTGHTGQDMHDVPGLQRHVREGRHHELRVQEHVHDRPSAAGLIHHPMPNPRERGLERLSHARQVRRIEDDLFLSPRVRTEGGRDPNEDTGPSDFFGRHAGRDTPPGHGNRPETKSLWPTWAKRRNRAQRAYAASVAPGARWIRRKSWTSPSVSRSSRKSPPTRRSMFRRRTSSGP